MPNMNPKKTPAPEQDPKVRAHNFLEVTQMYTPEQAQEEAQRCLNCKNATCRKGLSLITISLFSLFCSPSAWRASLHKTICLPHSATCACPA